MEKDVEAGLGTFDEILSRGDIWLRLRIEKEVPNAGDLTWQIQIGGRNGTSEIVVPESFLAKLPNSPKLREATNHYARSLEKRLSNPLPSAVSCLSGLPITVEISWPLRQSANGPHRWVHVSVSDLSHKNVESKFTIVVDDYQDLITFEQNPFLVEPSIVNEVRVLVDAGQLSFHSTNSLPSHLPQFSLRSKNEITSTLSQDKIRDFLVLKVYWLGFSQGHKDTPIWISDPWDAQYLGVDEKSLMRVAQILEAQQMFYMGFKMDDFASARRKLLRQASTFEVRPNKAEDKSPKLSADWDLFISHAREDKDDFVRPLAEALRAEGLKVWYDDFTLKMGDSLRRSIDRGLANSRYGVVMLSPSFFAKQWTQWELDGLVEKEIKDGRKVILPVWHKVTHADVFNQSPSLADKKAFSSEEGIDKVLAEILDVIREE